MKVSPFSLIMAYTACEMRQRNLPSLKLVLNEPKYWERQIWTNNVDLDLTAPSGESDQGQGSALFAILPAPF